MQVTVTGGVGNPDITLHYHKDSPALVQAQRLAASISNTFTSATYYSQATPPSSAGGGYLIAKRDAIGSTPINATNFSAVVIQNTKETATVIGGGNVPQTVLASNGGLTFTSMSGDTTVVAGGGGNDISFAGNAGSTAVYTSGGNDTIVGGNGQTTIKAGGGMNAVTIGGGSTYDVVSGRDSIQLGSGTETIRVLGTGSALITGAASVSGAAGIIAGQRNFTMQFVSNGMASTVLSGAGSYSINGGSGGGVFHGGSAGGNLIAGGAGSVTIFGGGTGDVLKGGSAQSSITAGSGNETLVGGDGASTLTGSGSFGSDVFTFRPDGGIAGVTDTVTNFTHGMDFINVTGYGAGEEASVISQVNHEHLPPGGNASFTLSDGTKVVLDGVTHLSGSDFK